MGDPGPFKNGNYIKSVSGLLMLFETLFGIVVLGLVADQMTECKDKDTTRRELFLLVTATTFTITTFLLLISSIASSQSAESMDKSLFELLYHCFACLLYLAASITILVMVHQFEYAKSTYDALLAAGVLALFNSILYLVSAIFSYKSKA